MGTNETPKKPPFKLTDFLKAREDRYIEIEGKTGRVFKVPPPDLWPDAAIIAAKAEDPVTMAKALLKPAEYKAWTEKEGGSANILLSIIQEATGMTPGE